MIWIFKTSVETIREVRELSPLLNSIVGQDQWNFDLENCDKILRLVCDDCKKIEKIIQHFTNNELQIRELE